MGAYYYRAKHVASYRQVRFRISNRAKFEKRKTTANNRVIAAAVLISRLCLSQAFRELEPSRVSAVEDVQERLPHVVRVFKIGRTRSD